MVMRLLDLFSGIGGFSYAAEKLVGGYETVAFCEQDEFCQKVLRKHWKDVPIYDDVRTIDAARLGRIDIVAGGFPCQSFSIIRGKTRKGTDDHRYLWQEMFAVAKMVQANWIVGENVIGLQSMGLEQILFQLESEGYQSQVFNIPALSCGANHQRQRLFIVAHSNGSSFAREWMPWRLEKTRQSHLRYFDVGKNATTNWQSESRVYRRDDGISKRLDSIRKKRLKSLGNSVCPQVVAQILQSIKVAEHGEQ